MKLSRLYSDGMVLQRDQKNMVSGKTKPFHPVTLTFLDKTYRTTAEQNGNFSFELDPLDPGGPYNMEIRADEVIIDRKSTRLNSSHVAISYAVFCLKKKNKTNKYV